MIIRSHEVKDEGYLVEHDGKLVTVFSAPNYCDQVGNKVPLLFSLFFLFPAHKLFFLNL